MALQWLLTALSCLVLSGCGRSRAPDVEPLTIAAAANLTGVMDGIAAEFEKSTHIPVVLSYGSTAQLSHQIEHGGPFDVFTAADTQHVDELIQKGKLQASSRAVYARGQLALWIPDPSVGVRRIEDLTQSGVRFIALAQPQLAPYGDAAVQALRSAGIWQQVQTKITYANSVSMARQFASSGNANAAFTALSLVQRERGTVITVDPRLYRPLDQALAIVTASRQQERARQFSAFLLGNIGRSTLSKAGYLLP